MKKLKEVKPQHNHNFTDWLKFILFAILMLAPILSIATRCLYVICNKNAKDSYYGETINQEGYTNVDYDKLKPNETYYFNNELLLQTYTQTQQSAIYYSSINWVAPLISFDLSNANNFRFYVNSEGIPRVYFYNDNSSFGRPFDLNTESLNFSFTYVSSTNLNLNENLLSNVNFQIKTYNKYSYLDNAFEYSVEQLEQSNTFAWTKQTATYDVFNNMLTGLTIQNGILPLLLTYWMMLIVVYIIVDIIIKTFTFITHLING